MKYIQVIIVIISVWFIPIASASKHEKSVSINFGTGWFVYPGFVVTNNHVVSQHDRAVIILTDKSELNTKVVVRDVANDIALLRIVDEAKLPAAIPLANRLTSVGEKVFTIGYPHPDVMGSNPKLSVGIISAKTGLANDPRIFQISTPLQAGNSGGPLINMYGEVVGIVTSKLNAMKMFKWTGDIPQNVNYAVKIGYLRTLLDINNEQKPSIKNLPSGQSNLVALTKNIQNSIVIIKSGQVAARKPKPVVVYKSGPKNSNNKKSNPVTSPPTKVKHKEPAKKVALFTHMRRGDYANAGGELDSTAVYSKNTAMLLKRYIEKSRSPSLKVVHNLHGDISEGRYYHMYNARKTRKLCKNLGVDYLFAVKNDYPVISYYYEEFDLVIKDCATGSEFSKMYNIEIKTKDKFNYEVDIRAAIKKYMELFQDM